MNELQTINAASPDGVHNFMFGLEAVRVVAVGAEPWFVTRDLCAILGIADARAALRGLSVDEKGGATILTPGGPQKLNVCNESGLYALIFKSRKTQAREFRHWVTGTVLPSVRKNGRVLNGLTPRTVGLALGSSVTL
jgi:prophage antirepressor-like protein